MASSLNSRLLFKREYQEPSQSTYLIKAVEGHYRKKSAESLIVIHTTNKHGPKRTYRVFGPAIGTYQGNICGSRDTIAASLGNNLAAR
jgi:hypothetical protein